MPAILATSASFAAAGLALFRGQRRSALSRAKHRSLTGHARWSRRVAALIPFYEYGEDRFFRCDDPPDEVASRRRAGFMRLSRQFAERFPRTIAATAAIADDMSDVQFTGAYRVPFQFSGFTRRHLPSGSVLASSAGNTVTDLDGNVFFDLTGSYGVNLLGHDAYKACIDAGAERVRDLGPVLGSFHPVVQSNVSRIRAISALDEVSFHMSGTEAVMQAVRLARYHTGRPKIVRFCGAYHGWWGDVQPGVGNPAPARDTLTLAELSGRTLHVLRTRRDIACVLVNPLQALHPNASAPADSALVDSSRRAGFDRGAYTAWLQQLRAACDVRGVVLIFDEVFVGFRLAPNGARAYFGVQPDMITYGKTLGGGLPVGVLCGRAALMRRYNAERPVDVCFARGTFNSHPYVMGAMGAFLDRLELPETQALFHDLDGVWDHRIASLNARLAAEGVPVRLANLSTIVTVCYTRPSRYNWMLQYYLRAEGLALSWVGTGRLIFSLSYTAAEFGAVADRFVSAGLAMLADGWWWTPPGNTDKRIRRRILAEVMRAAWRRHASNRLRHWRSSTG